MVLGEASGTELPASNPGCPVNLLCDLEENS